jgi:Uma2 family endonuclease
VAQAIHHRFSFEEYVRFEEDCGAKHEFVGGNVYAMSGGTPEHAAITANMARLLGNALDQRALEQKPCRVYSPDLRVRVAATGLGTYADVTVICGHLELDPADPKRHTALNPKLIVEVLSPSTEDYDRGDKLGNYKLIPSLSEVVLVAHDRREVEIVRREDDGSWSRHIARAGDSVDLESLGCALSVAEIYRDPLTGAGG